MTIVVTVRVNDGIVLAADSATSFFNEHGLPQKVYNNANKVFNLVKVWPIGAMTYGSGSIGAASISTLSKDFRRRLTPTGNADDGWRLNRDGYTIEEVADKAKRFFFEECYKNEYPDGMQNFGMGYRVCGYSANSSLPEAWEIRILEDRCEGPHRLYREGDYGPRWAGENEALDRLVLGIGSRAFDALREMGVDDDLCAEILNGLSGRLYQPLFLPAMPIQDAIDLATFLVDAAAKFSHFSLRPATVGGPLEVATITKHEGFKWVFRKHYYKSEYNREGSDANEWLGQGRDIPGGT